MNEANNINAMIWNDALKLLENDVNKPTFDLWFKSTELAAYYGENIIIKVQNDYAKNFLTNNFVHVIKNHLESMLNHTVKLQFVTPQEKDQAIGHLLQQHQCNHVGNLVSSVLLLNWICDQSLLYIVSNHGTGHILKAQSRDALIDIFGGLFQI